tara:strand:+ start:403 stop:651 length:249 start_codon:yes stop_codon:yes gene_type:complete
MNGAEKCHFSLFFLDSTKLMEDQRLSWYQWYSFEPDDVQLMKEHIVFLQEKVDSLEQSETDPMRMRKLQLSIDAIKYTYGLS